jgi:hypothetical protein
MASVASINPGLADLLQTLANIDSPVVSSPAAVSALEKASPTDLVQLSEAAMQLQGLDAMFGIQNGLQSGTQDGSGATNLEDLLNGAVAASVASPVSTVASTAAAGASSGSANGSSSSITPATASLADQLASYQLSAQTSEVQTLLDPGAASGSSDSLLNLIA